MIAIGIIGLVLIWLVSCVLFLIFGQLARIADACNLNSGECEETDCEYNCEGYCLLCVLNRGKFEQKI